MAALTITKLLDSGLGPEWAASYLGQTLASASSASPFKKKKATYTSAAGATAAYGINSIYANILTVAASGTTTLDMTAIQDISGQTQSWARLKAIYALLLGTDDNGGITVQASSLTIGAGASNGHLLFLANASDKVKMEPGMKYSVQDFSAAGKVVTSSLKTIDIINGDSVNSATLALVLGGSLS
jgi:hypothetical protein